MRTLTAAQMDRASGVLLGAACGDALGAGYEFGTVRLSGSPEMIGGGLGNFAPGAWTDDTAQAVAIAQVASTGADLRTEAALSAIAQRFADWFADGPADVGIQTSAVLRQAGRHPTGDAMSKTARELHERTGRSAGNGSLMRTGVVALAHLDDPAALVEAAMAVSALTHYDRLAQEGCALWCLIIRHAVLHGALPNAEDVVGHLPDQAYWTDVLHEAETKPPSTFQRNGWVVGALQAAWSAIRQTPIPVDVPCRHLQDALATAVGIGHDTDTVAAIAGAVLGARWGVSAIPARWRRLVHGWPGLRAQDLVTLALLTATAGRPDRAGWPGIPRMDYSHIAGHDSIVRHPDDPGVWIGGIGGLDRLPPEVDAVVTLCRYGAAQIPPELEHVVFRLMDTHAADNPNLAFVIDDAARTIANLRAEGRNVFLHCVAGHSRTPAVAIRYGVLRGASLPEATRRVRQALPFADPNLSFTATLAALAGASDGASSPSSSEA